MLEMLPHIGSQLVNERKFSGGVRLQSFALSVLDAWCIPDGEYPEGLVRSIYYDTPHLDCYRAKVNGDNLKVKVRVRWYGGENERSSGDIPVYIEMKLRIGSARYKHRTRVETSAKWITGCDLSDPSFGKFISGTCAAAGVPEAASWLPTARISYDRRRYVCPLTGGRIAFDWNIRADKFNRTIFPHCGEIVELPFTVCELKNSGGPLPPWAETLSGAGFKYGSFSKYGECVSRLLYGVTQ